jgi:hypothetical protein
LFKIEYQKREAHQARSRELEGLKEKISRGLNHDYDSELVSEAEYRYFLKQHEDSLVEREMSSIRAQLANGEELSYDSSILSDLQAQALVEEHQNQRKHTELDRIRLMLLNSEDLAYDETLISPRELDDVKSEVSSKRFLWLHSRQRPNAQPYGVSNYGAERLVSDWLVYLGCQDVILTQASQDGGVDVETANHVCQVKYYKNQGVSVQEAREIFGVASALGKVAMVFTSSDLTAAAYEFANQVGIIAVQFNVENSFLVGLNYYGEQLLVEGEYE